MPGRFAKESRNNSWKRSHPPTILEMLQDVCRDTNTISYFVFPINNCQVTFRNSSKFIPGTNWWIHSSFKTCIIQHLSMSNNPIKRKFHNSQSTWNEITSNNKTIRQPVHSSCVFFDIPVIISLPHLSMQHHQLSRQSFHQSAANWKYVCMKLAGEQLRFIRT